jgi:hypothetical protein
MPRAIEEEVRWVIEEAGKQDGVKRKRGATLPFILTIYLLNY